jgi:hypothetical protein
MLMVRIGLEVSSKINFVISIISESFKSKSISRINRLFK